MNSNDISFLMTLEDVIRRRTSDGADHSYTASLFNAGTRRIAQKVGEEGLEVALAAAAGDKQEILEESADLLYHLFVLLANAELSLADVVKVLEERHRQ